MAGYPAYSNMGCAEAVAEDIEGRLGIGSRDAWRQWLAIDLHQRREMTPTSS